MIDILSNKSVLKKKARREMHTALPVPEEKIKDAQKINNFFH
jgi:hypothetical protein